MKISPCLSPFVSGFPRTGFSLTVGVIHHILRATHLDKPGYEPLKLLCRIPGREIARQIEKVFIDEGITEDLIYNDNFKVMLGGPQWVREGSGNCCCFRKYIGVKGLGDFSFITSHPSSVLECFEIPCSHVGPSEWLTHQRYRRNKHFVSVRNPIGTFVSACFSINAIASEYIQRFYSAEMDNDRLRQDLASYKLTDTNFMEALLDPYKAYLDELSEVLDRYSVVKWEILIADPLPTIAGIGDRLELKLSEEACADIWKKIDHVNLTGAHKHNLRKGSGKAGGWKKWATNEHIDIMQGCGFGKYFDLLDYGIPEYLDTSEYTPFQKKVSKALQQGKILHDYDDEELFGFAFQKSNLNFSRFDFKTYPWRSHTRIERSCFSNDELLLRVSDVAENSCEKINIAIELWTEKYKHESEMAEKISLIKTMEEILANLFIHESDLRHWKEEMVRLVKEEHGCQYPAPEAGLLFIEKSAVC